MNHLVYFLIFASVGMATEVVFTGIADYRKKRDLRLAGRSYIWMLPIFGLTYPLLYFSQKYLSNTNILLRGLVYTLALYTIEYVSGWAIRKLTGKCPWEDTYHGSRWSVHDLIRLDYAPAWFVFTLVFERLYIFLLG